jgi:hypothetical protein
MGQLLSKITLVLLFFISAMGISQTGSDADNVFRPQEYKDQEQFKNFYKRRNAIGKWQINQLKNGALCIRLHTNKTLVDGLRKMGKADLAAQKEYEMLAINKNIVMAFTKYYTFSKVYFFFSNHSDTLLQGARSGIFLDTNLVVDTKIEMKESFYLLAEKDDAYNSSIGFVKETDAKSIKENGNASKECAMVIKNKYGHQLKDPFPFFVLNKSTVTGTPVVNLLIGGVKVPVTVEKKNRLERHFAYVNNLNKSFFNFYNQNKDYQVTEPDIQPFLY